MSEIFLLEKKENIQKDCESKFYLYDYISTYSGTEISKEEMELFVSKLKDWSNS